MIKVPVNKSCILLQKFSACYLHTTVVLEAMGYGHKTFQVHSMSPDSATVRVVEGAVEGSPLHTVHTPVRTGRNGEGGVRCHQ